MLGGRRRAKAFQEFAEGRGWTYEKEDALPRVVPLMKTPGRRYHRARHVGGWEFPRFRGHPALACLAGPRNTDAENWKPLELRRVVVSLGVRPITALAGAARIWRFAASTDTGLTRLKALGLHDPDRRIDVDPVASPVDFENGTLGPDGPGPAASRLADTEMKQSTTTT